MNAAIRLFVNKTVQLNLTDNFFSSEKKMTEIQISVSKLESQVDYLENQSRRNDLRFEGIATTQSQKYYALLGLSIPT